MPDVPWGDHQPLNFLHPDWDRQPMSQSPDLRGDNSTGDSGLIYTSCGVLLLGFLGIDLAVPLGVAVGVLYIVPILLSMWTPRKELTWILATAASVLIVVGYMFSPPGPSAWQSVSNRTLSLMAIWVTAVLVFQRRAIEEKREEAIRAKERAWDEIRILQGFLPICSSCKRIRDGEGHWRQIEAYIREHSEAQFSHGICPECAMKLYPELYEEEAEPKG